MVIVPRVSAPDSPGWLSFELCPASSFAGRGTQASSVRHTFAGDRQETIPTLRMLTNDSGRHSACPQEWVEQAVKGVRGFDGVGTLITGGEEDDYEHRFLDSRTRPEIAHLVGRAITNVTERVYRKELRPVLSSGATAMDALFGARQAGRSDSSLTSKPPTQPADRASRLPQAKSDQGCCWWAILDLNQ
jgi:hypothetical protein